MWERHGAKGAKFLPLLFSWIEGPILSFFVLVDTNDRTTEGGSLSYTELIIVIRPIIVFREGGRFPTSWGPVPVGPFPFLGSRYGHGYRRSSVSGWWSWRVYCPSRDQCRGRCEWKVTLDPTPELVRVAPLPVCPHQPSRML